MVEVVINGQQYRFGKLDAFKQFHVSRKIAPVVPTLIPVFTEIASRGDGFLSDTNRLAETLLPFAEAIADMDDAKTEYVLATCLAVCQRNTGNAWASVWNAQANVCMFDDMDMSVILPLVVHVIKDSLGSFINGLLTAQADSEAQM